MKCIYIDPPYNTGQDERGDDGKRTGWVYNDNVNGSEMREWLGKVVGAEAEDLSRHDKWLCMMYPRLRILRDFLRDDGVIFASIDDIELASLRFLFDEIFGIANRVGMIVWKNATDNNPTQIASEHEYVLCYAKRKQNLPSEWKSTTLAVKGRLLEIGDAFVRDYPDQEARQAAYTQWFRRNKDQLWPFDRYKYIDVDGIYTGIHVRRPHALRQRRFAASDHHDQLTPKDRPSKLFGGLRVQVARWVVREKISEIVKLYYI